MESMSELHPLLSQMREHREMTGGAGSDAGCRSSLLLGSGSSGGRGSSQGKGSGGRGANKGVSSGGSKKKAGWEDAELEFYKEAYPMPPHEGGYSQHLATLLPSTRYVNTMGR
ncbi:merozoite surface antigen 2, allelic form 4-like, partial [Hyalella azteca]|uniref:Merozoite surface antigen 2, allelic form 4-like n=1 Tax=Hyalella azteca TaxID=294128 RepID=A0A979FKG8_HYAAZ